MTNDSQSPALRLFQAIYDNDAPAVVAWAEKNGASLVLPLGEARNELQIDKYWQPEENATPLSYAARLDRAPIVRWLLTVPEARATENLGGMLIEAILRRNMDVAVALAEDGGSNALSGRERQWKRPPLGLAAQHGESAVARALLSKGADPMERDRGGNTPLILAGEAFGDETMKILLGVLSATNVNAQNNRGETAMMRACAHGNEDAVRTLLADGRARLDFREKRGKNALEVALAAPLLFGAKECAALLASQPGGAEAVSEWAISTILKNPGEGVKSMVADRMELLAEWMSAEAAVVCAEKLGAQAAPKLHAKAEAHILGKAAVSNSEPANARGEETGPAGSGKGAQPRRL